MSSDETHLRHAVQLLRERLPAVVAVYLFGSQARDAARPASDIDLAVLTARDAIDAETRWTVQQDLSIDLGRDVDLVDLRGASTVMQVQVLAHSQLLFEADPTVRHAFEMYAYSDYALLNEERAGILRDIRARGRVYDR